MDDQTNFLRLLHRISKHADDSHIKTAKFLLKDKITRKKLEECKDMKDVFDKLLMKDLMGPENTQFLRELVEEIFEDAYITRMLDEFEKLFAKRKLSSNDAALSRDSRQSRSTDPNSCNTRLTSTPQPLSQSLGRPLSQPQRPIVSAKFRGPFEHAATELGADWKVLARLMNLTEQDILEIERAHGESHTQALTAMELWHSKQVKPTTREFRRLLRGIPRNDIADDLHEMTLKKVSP